MALSITLIEQRGGLSRLFVYLLCLSTLSICPLSFLA